MLRKLLAAMFAATLMAGAAWAGQDAIDAWDPDASETTPLPDDRFGTNNDAVSGYDDQGTGDGLLGTGLGVTAGKSVIASSVANTESTAYNLGTIKSLNTGTEVAIGIGLLGNGTALGITSQDFHLKISGLQANDEVWIGGTAKSLTINGNVNIVHGTPANASLNVTGTKFTQTGLTTVSGLTAFDGSIAEITGGVATKGSGDAYTDGTQYLGGLEVTGGSYKNSGDVVLGDDSIFGDTTAGTAAATTVTIDGNVYLAGDATDLTIITGSTVTVGNIGFSQATNANKVVVDEASTLNINNGSTAVVFKADAAGNDSHTLEIDDGSTVNVQGELQLTGGDSANAAKSALSVLENGAVSKLNADSLTIGDDDSTATTVINSDFLTTTVTNATIINDAATYKVGGILDTYTGGITVNETGALTGITSAAVTITTADEYVTLQDGGTIDTTAAGALTFTINGKGVKVVNDVADADVATIDADASGGIGISIQNLEVNGDLELVSVADGDSMITVRGDYIQEAGVVEQTGAGNLTIKGNAKIGGAGKEANFILFAADGGTDDLTTFEKGLTVAAQGTLSSKTGAPRSMDIGANALTLEGGTVDASVAELNVVGTAASTIAVTKNGSEIKTATAGNDFIAATSTLVVNSADGYDTAKAGLYLSGTGKAVVGDVKIQKGELLLGAALDTNKDVVIESGAYLANAGAAVITATGATGKTFNAKAGSNIRAVNGDYTLTGFTDATLDGNVEIDATGGTAYKISTNATNATIGNNAVINLSVAAAQAAAAAVAASDPESFVVVDKTSVGALEVQPGAKIQSSALGQFSFDLGAAGGAHANQFVLTDAKNVASGADTEENRNLIHQNIQSAWGDYGHGAEIDRTLSDAAFNATLIDGAKSSLTIPNDTNEWGDPTFGRITLDMLNAIASTASARTGYSEGIGKGIFQNGDVSETLNAGVGEIRGITSAIGTRNVQLRGQMAGAGDVYYEYANPTLLLNNDYANRIWAGYIGQWEKADERNGVSGYDYDSNGFIVGYDRLVGCNFAFGGAFAYSRGDYEDKSALTNDSKIDNYSFNGYATYSALNGVFASLFGGYTHQKNDIKAVYARGALPSVSKSSDYDTDYWHIGGQLGYDFQPVDGLVLTPSIGLQYIHGRADSHFSNWFSTTKGGGFVNSTTQEALLLPIEIAARYTINFSDCSRLAIEGNLGYSYNFLNDNGQAGMTLANITNGAGNQEFIAGYDRDAGRHTFNAGAGLRYTFNRFDIGVKYDYYLQQDAHAHRVMGSVGVSF